MDYCLLAMDLWHAILNFVYPIIELLINHLKSKYVLS